MTSGIIANSVAALISKGIVGKDTHQRDVYGETFTVMAAVFAPGASSEAIFGEDLVVTAPTLYLPVGTSVSAVDAVIPQVTVDASGNPTLDSDGHPQGDRYDVDGLPESWPGSPFTGWQPQYPVIIRLKGQTG